MLKLILILLNRTAGGRLEEEKEECAALLEKAGYQVFLEKEPEETGCCPRECMLVTDCPEMFAKGKRRGFACVFYTGEGSTEGGNFQAEYAVESLEALTPFYAEMIYCHTRGLPCTIARTERLFLREMTVEDVSRLYEIYQEPEITRYMENLYEDEAEEVEFTRAYIQHMYRFYQYGMWSVCLKDGYLIGRAGISHREINGESQLEVGYVIDKKYQRRGYALEALREVVKYAQNHLGAEFLNAFIRVGNSASVGLLKKLGASCGYKVSYLLTETIDGLEYEMYRIYCENASAQ